MSFFNSKRISQTVMDTEENIETQDIKNAKYNEIKFKITKYANNARNEINKNANMKEYISRLNKTNDLFKIFLSDLMLKKMNNDEIYNFLIQLCNIIKEDNKILQDGINEKNTKYNNSLNVLKNETEPLMAKLEKLKNYNFLLHNKNIYKDNIITRDQSYLFIITNDIENDNDDQEFETIIDKNIKEFDVFLKEISKVYQETLYISLKEHNKIKLKNSKKSQKISYLNILLNNHSNEQCYNIETYKNTKENSQLNDSNLETSITSFKEFELSSSMSTIENLENIIDDDDTQIKSDIFNLPQKKLVKSNINKSLSNNFNKSHKKVFSQDNKIYQNELMHLKKEFVLPKLNLKQINFNKNNKSNLHPNCVRGDMTSLFSKYDKKKEKQEQITRHKIKNKIKKIKKTILRNQKIINSFKDFYCKLMKKYSKSIYQPEIESYVLTTQESF